MFTHSTLCWTLIKTQMTPNPWWEKKDLFHWINGLRMQTPAEWDVTRHQISSTVILSTTHTPNVCRLCHPAASASSCDVTRCRRHLASRGRVWLINVVRLHLLEKGGGDGSDKVLVDKNFGQFQATGHVSDVLFWQLSPNYKLIIFKKQICRRRCERVKQLLLINFRWVQRMNIRPSWVFVRRRLNL